ncbi:MAG TPA: hypothetical protein VFR70_02390, partial [Flavobacterium sp.]|nr:hypothetical protein [Flavobacterium sp.]
ASVPETAEIHAETEAVLAKDSLMLDSKTVKICADKVVVSKLKSIMDKDSTVTAFFRIDFFKGKNKIYSHPVQKAAYGFDDSAEWSISQEFMADNDRKNIDKRFVHLDNGIAACGYSHTEFLFFLGEKDVQLISEWESMGDSGYGVDSEFMPKFKSDPIVSFAVRTVEVSPDETAKDSLDRLIISYSDSVRYDFSKNRWKKTPLSAKGKAYRTEKRLFDEYYK